MNFISKYDIISKQVINDKTGEIEVEHFKQVKETKKIKGGFRMVYAAFDIAVSRIIKSQIDYLVLIYIRDLFTYKQVEVHLSGSEIAKLFEISRSKVNELINRSVNEELLFRVKRGVYRLNPYMYLPFRANGEELQKEWSELTKDIKSRYRWLNEQVKNSICDDMIKMEYIKEIKELEKQLNKETIENIKNNMKTY